MKKIVICACCIMALAACKREDTGAVQHCGGYDVIMEIAENGETMRANINGDEFELSHVASASGVKYGGILNDTVVVLMSDGEVWTLMLDDETIIDCKTK